MFHTCQKRMNRKVTAFEPMIEVRKQGHIAAMRFKRLQQRSEFIISAK